MTEQNKKRFSKWLAGNAMAVRLWFVFSCLLLACLVAEPFLLIINDQQHERIVVLDGSGNFFAGRLEYLSESREVAIEIATLATIALLAHNEKSFEWPDLVKKLFVPQTKKVLDDLRLVLAKELEADQMKGYPSIERFWVKPQDGMMKVIAYGKEVFAGHLEGEAYFRTQPFQCKLVLVRNKNAIENKMHPYQVGEFQVLWKTGSEFSEELGDVDEN